MKKGLLSIIAFLLFSACNGGDMPEKTISFTALKDVPVSSWEKLAQKNIFFGHQSVGFNIMDGIKDLMKENPQIKLRSLKPTILPNSIDLFLPMRGWAKTKTLFPRSMPLRISWRKGSETRRI
ncbi:MAG: hypothetical protein BA868_08700 [Desulfobacterales bacterium C00003106]|nr:MAG: hypothetical protein BA868_08700 [Desulfobacterales bacterium C00003106]